MGSNPTKVRFSEIHLEPFFSFPIFRNAMLTDRAALANADRSALHNAALPAYIDGIEQWSISESCMETQYIEIEKGDKNV